MPVWQEFLCYLNMVFKQETAEKKGWVWREEGNKGRELILTQVLESHGDVASPDHGDGEDKTWRVENLERKSTKFYKQIHINSWKYIIHTYIHTYIRT